MSKIYTSADQLIGKTPLLELTHIEKKYGLKAKVLAKLEYFNPAGSVKDRIARKMLDDAEAAGKLTPDSVIIEPTSGNTGVGLALVAQQRGYRTIFTLPDKVSESKRAVLRAYAPKSSSPPPMRAPTTRAPTIRSPSALPTRFPADSARTSTTTPTDR